jgi:hypothetical protein
MRSAIHWALCRIESQIQVPEKQLIFHPHAQQNAFRRGARPQSRLFVAENRGLRHNPNFHPALLRLSAIISQYMSRR